MAESLEDLQAKLATYDEQFQQVEMLLNADPGNEELSRLHNDLQEVIRLTKDLISIQMGGDATSNGTKGTEINAAIPATAASTHASASEAGQLSEAALSGDANGSALSLRRQPNEPQQRWQTGSTYEAKWEDVWYPAVAESFNPETENYVVTIYGPGTAIEVKGEDIRPIRPSSHPLESHEVHTGLECQAKYYVDGHYYTAVIKEMTERGYKVTFPEYGNEEEVPLEYLRSIAKAAAPGAKGAKKGVDTTLPKIREIPENLKVLPTDTEEERERKRKKIKAIKKRNRDALLETDGRIKQSTWQDFATNAKKPKGAMSGLKKGSIFASPVSVDGKVGVVGSGKGMTQFDDTRKKYVLK